MGTFQDFGIPQAYSLSLQDYSNPLSALLPYFINTQFYFLPSHFRFPQTLIPWLSHFQSSVGVPFPFPLQLPGGSPPTPGCPRLTWGL